MDYLGEFAALGTAVLGAFNSIFLTLAGRRVGSGAVNGGRLLMALGVLGFMHYALFGTFLPLQAKWGSLLALGVSGLIGLALADALLIEAILILGPRVALVMMSASPIFSVLLGRLFLGQVLSGVQLAAILVTVTGIGLVLVERAGPPDAKGRSLPAWVAGSAFGVGSAFGDAVGMLLSNLGMQDGLHAVSANLVRVAAGTAAVVLWLILRFQFVPNLKCMKDRRALLLVGGVAATGPVLGVLLSLYAITRAPLGIAVTLMSLAPLFLLLTSVVYLGERCSWKAVMGTLCSMVGAGALLLG